MNPSDPYYPANPNAMPPLMSPNAFPAPQADPRARIAMAMLGQKLAGMGQHLQAAPLGRSARPQFNQYGQPTGGY